jgi:hypothetical protein
LRQWKSGHPAGCAHADDDDISLFQISGHSWSPSSRT